MSANTKMVLASVGVERERQDKKWGEQNHHPALWLSIIAEELGEAAKAALEGKALDLYTELVQVAAVAVAACECLLRHSGQVLPDLTALQREVEELRALNPRAALKEATP